MKIEQTAKTLHVEAKVRYWDDTIINDDYDTELGDNVPCKDGEYWKPIIDIQTGRIINWQSGITATIQYKICDEGKYYIKNDLGHTIMMKEGYVPKMMCPNGEGYGDYIYMSIRENGSIDDWEINFNGFWETNLNKQ